MKFTHVFFGLKIPGDRIERWMRWANFINPAVAAVPVGIRIRMGGAFVEPIRDENRAAWSHGDIARSEPGVMGHQQFAAVTRFECRTPRFEIVPLHAVAQKITGNVFAAELS